MKCVLCGELAVFKSAGFGGVCLLHRSVAVEGGGELTVLPGFKPVSCSKCQLPATRCSVAGVTWCDKHRPASDEHRPASAEHRPASAEHRPASAEHRPAEEERGSFSLKCQGCESLGCFYDGRDVRNLRCAMCALEGDVLLKRDSLRPPVPESVYVIPKEPDLGLWRLANEMAKAPGEPSVVSDREEDEEERPKTRSTRRVRVDPVGAGPSVKLPVGPPLVSKDWEMLMGTPKQPSSAAAAAPKVAVDGKRSAAAAPRLGSLLPPPGLPKPFGAAAAAAAAPVGGLLPMMDPMLFWSPMMLDSGLGQPEVDWSMVGTKREREGEEGGAGEKRAKVENGALEEMVFRLFMRRKDKVRELFKRGEMTEVARDELLKEIEKEREEMKLLEH